MTDQSEITGISGAYLKRKNEIKKKKGKKKRNRKTEK